MANPSIRVTSEERNVIQQFRAGKKPPPAKQAAADMRHNALQDKYGDLKAKYDTVTALAAELENRLGSMQEMKAAFAKANPYEIRIPSNGKPLQAVAVGVTGDWHLEEGVDPRKVEYRNEFSPEIAKKRLSKFFNDLLAEINMARHRYAIDELILIQLGDMISGVIHPELVETGAMRPTEAIIMAYEMMAGGIDFLLEHGEFKKIHVVCKVGNHGRTTQKTHISTAVENNFEFLCYQFLRQRYRDTKEIEWQMGMGYLDYVQIYDTVLRVHHGDAIRYQDGVGGLTIPLHKALARWDQLRPANVDVLGHWHQSIFSRRFVVNGSLIGYNPFGVFIRAAYEPAAQGFFLVRPDLGKTLESPIIVQAS